MSCKCKCHCISENYCKICTLIYCWLELEVEVSLNRLQHTFKESLHQVIPCLVLNRDFIINAFQNKSCLISFSLTSAMSPYIGGSWSGLCLQPWNKSFVNYNFQCNCSTNDILWEVDRNSVCSWVKQERPIWKERVFFKHIHRKNVNLCEKI